MTERLQKYLASAGLASRRQIEVWIGDGRITVNGQIAELGQKVSGEERICVDGKVVGRKRIAQRNKTIIYNKGFGEICSRSDPEGRPTMFDSLPKLAAGRWISVGRLDFQTTGLIIVTTDGELAHRLMHPSGGLLRKYSVRVHGEPNQETLLKLRKGVELSDGMARFKSLEFGGGEGRNRWFNVTVSEGRNRLVRRMWEEVGFEVSRLIRIGYGPLMLPRDLRGGRYRPLKPAELGKLYAAVKYDSAAETQGQ